MVGIRQQRSSTQQRMLVPQPHKASPVVLRTETVGLEPLVEHLGLLLTAGVQPDHTVVEHVTILIDGDDALPHGAKHDTDHFLRLHIAGGKGLVAWHTPRQ